MLNLVEMGTPEAERLARLKELAGMVARTARVPDIGQGAEKICWNIVSEEPKQT